MPDNPEPFTRLEAAEADKECGIRRGFLGANCAVCGSRVILHCDGCKIQVSACYCTLPLEEAREAIANLPQEREDRSESLRRKMQSKGFWTP